MDQRSFNALWPPEGVPACEEGMVLLKAWVDSEPGMRNMPLDRIPLAVMSLEYDSLESMKYLEHLICCSKCNEA